MRTETIPHTSPLPKTSTGIAGLDEITGGGLPSGRPTLVCGGPGCGKTVLALQFLAHGAANGEPGLFVSFEEGVAEIIANVAAVGIDAADLVERRLLTIDYVHLERSEFEETGAFDCEGLFIRIGHAIACIGARRVVLDTVEALFAGLPNEAIVRAELRRLFHWLREQGVTAVITAERGDGTLTRHGLEEYVSDCVIALDHRISGQTTSRRLRIVKYRGSGHGTDEYPFVIDAEGVAVWPATSARLEHAAGDERISTGVARLDAMLGGAGPFRGSTVLVTGTAGTGKTGLASTFADATCARGERCLYLAHEESPSQLQRNMRSIGVDLARWVDAGLLRIHAVRPSYQGLELHLATLAHLVGTFRPSAVVIDPITSLLSTASEPEVASALMRVIDLIKREGATLLMTSLTRAGAALEQTEAGIASLVDAWIVLADLTGDGERNRALHVVKARGMAHSNQMREFRLTSGGLTLEDVYVGPEGVLTGSARIAQEGRAARAAATALEEVRTEQQALAARREALERQIAASRASFAVEEAAVARLIDRQRARQRADDVEREQMARSRRADVGPTLRDGTHGLWTNGGVPA